MEPCGGHLGTWLTVPSEGSGILQRSGRSNWRSELPQSPSPSELVYVYGGAAMNERVVTTLHASTGNHERSLRSIAAEVLQELKEFVDTRVQMAKAEFQETIRAFKVGLPLVIAALAFLGTGFLLLTVAVVALVTVAFAGSAYQWFFAFIIVGVLWMALGGIAVFYAYNEFRGQGRFPKRTMNVLKADKVWLQSEARSR